MGAVPETSDAVTSNGNANLSEPTAEVGEETEPAGADVTAKSKEYSEPVGG
jgi:hypothetical protein